MADLAAILFFFSIIQSQNNNKPLPGWRRVEAGHNGVASAAQGSAAGARQDRPVRAWRPHPAGRHRARRAGSAVDSSRAAAPTAGRRGRQLGRLARQRFVCAEDHPEPGRQLQPLPAGRSGSVQLEQQLVRQQWQLLKDLFVLFRILEFIYIYFFFIISSNVTNLRLYNFLKAAFAINAVVPLGQNGGLSVWQACWRASQCYCFHHFFESIFPLFSSVSSEPVNWNKPTNI